MIFSLNLRIIAYLRRGVRALEAISGSLDVIAHTYEQEWAAKHAPRKPRLVEFGTMDQGAINEKWRREEISAGRMSEEE
jgi:hypothetical protein